MKIKLLFGILLILAPSMLLAQVVSSTGMGTVEYSGFFGSSDEREANRLALEAALDSHIANNGSGALVSLYEENRGEIMQSLDRFIVGSVVISEERDRSSRTYRVVMRAEINDALLRSYITSNFETNSIAVAERSLISFVFMSRMAESVQSFDDRVVQRVDTTENSSNRDEQAINAREQESITNGSVAVSGVSIEESASQSTNSLVVESGGSTTRRADVVNMQVTSSQDVNLQISGILSGSGYEVVEAEFIEGASNGKLRLDRIREEFSTGNDISAQTLSDAAEGMRIAGIPYFAIGTMDVGIRDIDPVSGNTRITVTVSGRVYDVTGRFPRTVSSVGPEQFSGIGPDENIARTNALRMAAESTAQQIADQLGVRNVR